MKQQKTKKKRIWLRILLSVIGVILAVVIAYLAYVFLGYSRIEDNVEVEVNGTATADEVKLDTEYTAVTYNVGFGAYTPDFTFFMDGGTGSWANSKESVIACIEGAVSVLKEQGADFAMVQEVDTDATRSYHVDEAAMIQEGLEGFCATQTVNYHSVFLMYPLTQPHGASNSGLLTLSDAQITSALRRSLPISTGFSKILDLDRCYAINRIKVENGKELVIFNVHLSAYGSDGDIRTSQLNMLFGDMLEEYEKGNYVVCGGDFNHDLYVGSKDIFNDEYEERGWAADFPDEMIPDGFIKVTDYASGVVTPTCRDCDIPYGEDSFTIINDGFFVSDNVEVTYVDVVDTGFSYSDHNPVAMKFKFN